jgi:hypothetical protein
MGSCICHPKLIDRPTRENTIVDQTVSSQSDDISKNRSSISELNVNVVKVNKKPQCGKL